MLQIVGALILLIAGFAILRLLFRALISTASALAGLILLCLFGPALLAGYITERITRLFHIRWLAGVFLTIAGMIISFMWGLVNATMFDRYLPFSCPLNTFVTDAVRFSPFHHH